MMIKSLLILLLLVFFQSCSKSPFQGDIQKNLEAMDKAYGKCNNPYRTMNKAQKRICEDKERAAGPDGVVGEPINITEIIENYRYGGKANVYSGMSTVNPTLWGASLALLEQYPLDIVDSQGGFISTDWITKKENPDQRCLIKVNIVSQELVSNGVNVKLICEQKEINTWYQDGISYSQEEKDLILKILDIAEEISITEKLS